MYASQVRQSIKALKLEGSKGHALAAVPLPRAFTSVTSLDFTAPAEDAASLQGVSAALRAAGTSMRLLSDLHIGIKGKEQW